MEKVQYNNRNQYLAETSKHDKKNLPLVFKIMYNNRLDNLGLPNLLKNCNDDESCLDVIHHILNKFPLICYKTDQNLQKQIVKAKFVH